jgi:ribonuclease HII
VPDFSLETEILKTTSGPVCGIDEAGRGPWAGPVVASAVVLDPDHLSPALIEGLDDSKKLSAKKRDILFDRLKSAEANGAAWIGIGDASSDEIDRLNILQATFLAMDRAVKGLATCPAHALVDGNCVPPLDCPATTIIKGDQKSLSIAAASIVAKVTRDRFMNALSDRFPGYGFERHAGYGTVIHREALERLGVTPHHRKSFAPIHKILCSD